MAIHAFGIGMRSVSVNANGIRRFPPCALLTGWGRPCFQRKAHGGIFFVRAKHRDVAEGRLRSAAKRAAVPGVWRGRWFAHPRGRVANTDGAALLDTTTKGDAVNEPLRGVDDYLIPTPEATGASVVPPHPLDLFSNEECRAWIAALVALRSTRPVAAPPAARHPSAKEAGEILNNAIAYAAAVPIAAFSKSRGHSGGEGLRSAYPSR